MHHLKANASIWDKHEPFVEAYNELSQAIDDCWNIAETQSKGSVGVSSGRDLMQKEVISRVYAIARIAKAFALNTDNRELYHASNHGKADLSVKSQTDLIATLRNMVNAASTYADELVRYGLPLQTYDDALKAIEAFAAMQSAVRQAIFERKALTGNTPALMKKGTLALAKLDNMIHFFEAEFPDFVAGYKAARTIIHVGIRHNKDDVPKDDESKDNVVKDDGGESG